MGREKHVDIAADMFRSLMRKSTRKKPWQERLKSDGLLPGSEKTEDEDEDKEDGVEEGEVEEEEGEEEEEDEEEEEKKKEYKKNLKVQNISTLKVFQTEVPIKYLFSTLRCPCLSVFILCSCTWQLVFVQVSMNPNISLDRSDLLWVVKITGGSGY